MAAGATGGEAGVNVIRIAGGGPILGVAAQAIHGRALETSAHVAGIAVQGGVRAGQGEAGKAQVVKLRAEPGIHAVTFLAGGGETGSRMVGIAGLLKLGRMATQAVGGEPLELAYGRVLVTAVALQQRVRPHQRKAVEVLLDVLHRNPPPFHCVAVFATRSKLAAVNVSVAVRAFRARVAEHQIGVTLAASYPLVHAAQGKLGLVVIEFWNAAYWFPRRKGMAVLAGEVQIPMRATGGGVCLVLWRRRATCARLRRERRSQGAEQKPYDQVHQQCRAQGIPRVSLFSHESHLAIDIAISWPSRVAGNRKRRIVTKGIIEVRSQGQQL